MYKRQDYSKIVTISKGRDAVDLALINDSEKGDVIVTQDYGVASLALGRKMCIRDRYCIYWDKIIGDFTHKCPEYEES